MSQFEIGDEVIFRIGSMDVLVTITNTFEDIGPGVYTIRKKDGIQFSVDESNLISKYKSLDTIYNTKNIEIAVRNMYEKRTRQSGDPGTGPVDIIIRFLLET